MLLAGYFLFLKIVTLVIVKRKTPNFIANYLTKLIIPPSARTIYDIDKIDESLTPNMRALRLTMLISEQLLTMGVAVKDVVNMARGITETYCKRRVHMDISYTLITISQDRGIDREPLTMIRTITLDDANYQTIQALQSLAIGIRDNHIPLRQAEQQVEQILSKPSHHSRWAICTAGGIVGAGVVVLYDGTLLMTGLSFMMGFLATGALRWLAKIGMPIFYSQTIVAFLITILAALTAWLNTFLSLEINTTLLVIGGIVLLVAGMMIVGAFQDAIDEYYITANAKLLKVMMATGGIVVGVLTGLYIATKFGVSFPTTPDRLTLADSQTQYIGAVMIAAAFAARNHSRWMGMLMAGGVGMFGWWISRIIMNLGFGAIEASAAAATAIGLLAISISRLWKFPSLAIIAAGIVPLVPGLSLYNGLMGIVIHPPNDPYFLTALTTLAQAVMIGLAVAAGASLGNAIGRPLRRKVSKLSRAKG